MKENADAQQKGFKLLHTLENCKGFITATPTNITSKWGYFMVLVITIYKITEDQDCLEIFLHFPPIYKMVIGLF